MRQHGVAASFFQQRALSPVEKQTQLDVQRESAMRSRADIELNHAGMKLRRSA
jgi:hypothetical protein